jgi:hypothetical protein
MQLSSRSSSQLIPIREALIIVDDEDDAMTRYYRLYYYSLHREYFSNSASLRHLRHLRFPHETDTGFEPAAALRSYVCGLKLLVRVQFRRLSQHFTDKRF